MARNGEKIARGESGGNVESAKTALPTFPPQRLLLLFAHETNSCRTEGDISIELRNTSTKLLTFQCGRSTILDRPQRGAFSRQNYTVLEVALQDPE